MKIIMVKLDLKVIIWEREDKEKAHANLLAISCI